jgi:hypothetical protein
MSTSQQPFHAFMQGCNLGPHQNSPRYHFIIKTTIMKQEEDNGNSFASGMTVEIDYLEGEKSVAIADPECGTPALEGKLINSTTSACVLINFISVGYILNPSGRRKIDLITERESMSKILTDTNAFRSFCTGGNAAFLRLSSISFHAIAHHRNVCSRIVCES